MKLLYDPVEVMVLLVMDDGIMTMRAEDFAEAYSWEAVLGLARPHRITIT